MLAGSVTATDPDHDIVSFAITDGADRDFFTISGSTGTLSWAIAPDYETKEDADANGVYEVTVTATDSHGAAASQAISVNVSNINEPGQTLVGNWFWHDTVSGGSGNDTIYLGLSGSVAYGNDGDDEIHGGQDDDDLYGGRGNDTLDGGAGDDLLVGGPGNDTMRGGPGHDYFALSTPTKLANGSDLILDFDVNGDVIGLLKGASGWNPSTVAGHALSSADFAIRNSVMQISASDTNKVIELQNAQTTAQMASNLGGAANAYVAVYNSTVGHVEIWYDSDWANTADRVMLVGLQNVTSIGGAFNAGEFGVHA